MAKKDRIDSRLEGKIKVKKLSNKKEVVLVRSEAIPLIKARSAAQVAVFNPMNGASRGFMTAMNLVVGG